MKKATKNDLDKLSNLLNLLKNEKNIKDFLIDLLSVSEIKDLAKRIKIAELLNQQELSYKNIAEKLKTSTTTVTRVAHWLNHGKGGLKKIVDQITQ